MADFSVVEKIKLFFDSVISTPFFLCYAIVGILLIILMILDIKKKKKFSKLIYILCLTFLFSFVVIKYFKYIIKIFDTFIEIVIKTLYFPNIAIYLVMLLISNITFLVILFSKKNIRSYKIISIIGTGIIDFLFIMILSFIAKNNIDISIDVKLFEDSNILTFLQLSMAAFTSMYLLLLFARLYRRFKLFDKNVTFDDELYPDMGLYVKENNIKGIFNDNEVKLIKIIDFSNKGDQDVWWNCGQYR